LVTVVNKKLEKSIGDQRRKELTDKPGSVLGNHSSGISVTKYL